MRGAVANAAENDTATILSASMALPELGGGFAGTPEEALEIWQAAAERWARLDRRLTPGTIAAYRKLAAPKLGGRVMILGVTPDLRDLVADAGARPVLIDMCAEMHDATTRMLRHADPAQETWIQADWCSLPVPAGTFDLVFGDMIWWSLSVARQHELRDAIGAALNSDGLFVGRLRFTDVRRARQDPVSVVAEYLERLERNPADSRRIESEFLSWLYDHTADHVGRRLDCARARALLHELASRSELRRGAEFLRSAAERLIAADWTSQSREELLALLRVRFEIVAEESAEDYEPELYPIVALRPH